MRRENKTHTFETYEKEIQKKILALKKELLTNEGLSMGGAPCASPLLLKSFPDLLWPFSTLKDNRKFRFALLPSTFELFL